MKLTIGLITLLFAVSTYAVIESDFSNAFDAKGDVLFKDQSFINVKNVSGGSIAAGSIVVLDTTEDDGISVTTSTSAVAVPHCMVVAAVADDAMVKCQVSGYTDKILFDASTTAVANEAMYIDTTAGYVRAVASASVAAYMVPVGSFLDASAASGAVEGYLRLQ